MKEISGYLLVFTASVERFTNWQPINGADTLKAFWAGSQVTIKMTIQTSEYEYMQIINIKDGFC